MKEKVLIQDYQNIRRKIEMKHHINTIACILFTVLLISCEDNTTPETEPLPTGTVTDIDGNTYLTIKVGNQWWMTENLSVSRYANGVAIPHITNSKDWKDLELNDKAYCFYNNDASLGYGALYTYAAATNGTPYENGSIQGVCPAGWHLPSNEEWKQLEDYLIANGYNYDESTNYDKIAKALAARSHWNSSDYEGTPGYYLPTNNHSGFSALPGGYRATYGNFEEAGNSAYWWSSSSSTSHYRNAYYFTLETKKYALEQETGERSNGFCVRCVKGTSPTEGYYTLKANDVTINEYNYITACNIENMESLGYNKLHIPGVVDGKTIIGIGNEVFMGKSIQEVKLPDGLEYIGAKAFADNQLLNSIILPQSPNNQDFGGWVYNDNQKLTPNVEGDYVATNFASSYSVALQSGTVTDIDGNTYRTVKKGNQWWMAENLEVTRYADGTVIPHITDNSTWGALGDNNTDKAYSFYNNDANIGYGVLYTFAAATNGTPHSGSGHVQGVCPDGWHLPSDDEWQELKDYLISNGYNYDGTTTNNNKIGKALAAQTGWATYNRTGNVGNKPAFNNRSGFTALPGGYRNSSRYGTFHSAGERGSWWSSTASSNGNAYYSNLQYSSESFSTNSSAAKSNGLPCRCVKD